MVVGGFRWDLLAARWWFVGGGLRLWVLAAIMCSFGLVVLLWALLVGLVLCYLGF